MVLPWAYLSSLRLPARLLPFLRFFDLLRIFDLNGLPSDTNPYLFNGALRY